MLSYVRRTCRTPQMHCFYRFLFWFSLFSICFMAANHLVSLQTHLHGMLAKAAGEVYGIWDSGWTTAGGLLLHPDSGRFITVENSCSGAGMCLFLCGIVFALPGGRTFRLTASLAGIGLIQCWNIIRIAHLFFLAVSRPDLFNFFHLHAWQAGNLVVMLLLVTVLTAFSSGKAAVFRWLRQTSRGQAVGAALLFIGLPVIVNTATAYAFGGGSSGGGGSGGSGGGGTGSAVPFLAGWQVLPLLLYIGSFFTSLRTGDE